MRIYLIGYMASGKTNLGRLLAEKLGYRFLDLDYMFEERYRISILDFFEKYDEEAFRKIERSLLRETISLEDCVISTGGGTPCFFDNMDIIKKAGFSIYLYREIPDLVARLKMVRRKRPKLKGVPADELHDRIAEQMECRAGFYSRADFVVKGGEFDPDKIVSMLRSRAGSI